MAPLEVATTTSNRAEAAGRMPSMEWEPKTLTLDQIKFARVRTTVESMQLHAAYYIYALLSVHHHIMEYLYVVTSTKIYLLPPKKGLFSPTLIMKLRYIPRS